MRARLRNNTKRLLSTRIFCFMFLFLSYFFGLAGITLNEQGEPDPSGKTLNLWAKDIYKPEMAEFRKNCHDYIKWEVEKSLRRSFYLQNISALHYISHNTSFNCLRYLNEYPQKNLSLAPLVYRIAKDKSVDNRSRYAVNILVAMGDTGLSYAKRLTDNEGKRQCYIDPVERYRILAKFKHPETISWFTSKLGDLRIRFEAAKMLGTYGAKAKSAIPELTKQLKSDDIYFRLHVAEALLKIDPDNPEAKKTVISDLAPQESREILMQLIKCACLVPDPRSLDFILENWASKNHYDMRSDLFKSFNASLDAIGEKSFPIIEKHLKGKNARKISYWSERYLIRQKEKSIPYILSSLDSDEMPVKVTIYRILGRIGPPAKSSIPKLLEKLKTANKTEKDLIFEVFEKIGPGAHSALPELASELKNTRYPHKLLKALLAISKKPEDIVKEFLKQDLVKNKKQSAFVSIIEHCENIPPEAIPVLKDIFLSKNGFRTDGATILRILKLSEKQKDFCETLIPFLPKLVESLSGTHRFRPVDLAIWYLSYSKDWDKTLSIFIPKIKMREITFLILKYAEMNRDPKKAYDWHKKIVKRYSKAYKKELLYYEKPEIGKKRLFKSSKANLIKLIIPESNLSKQDRMEILQSPLYKFKEKLHSQNIPALFELLNHKDEMIQKWAKKCLNENIDLNDCPPELFSNYINTLEKDLSSPNHKTRIATIKRLEKNINGQHQLIVFRTLLPVLLDDHYKISGQAVKALKTLNISILPELIKLLNGDDPFYATSACELIGAMSIYAKDAVPDLEKAMSNPDWTIRMSAIRALGDIGPPAKTSLPLMIKALDDKSKGVRKAAAEAIIILGSYLDEKKRKDPVLLEKIINCGIIENIRKDKTHSFKLHILEGL